MRTPRHSSETEMAVLGGLMLMPVEDWPKFRQKLNPEVFYRPTHQAIFRTVAKLLDQRREASLLSVPEAMGEKACDEIGGTGYLIECCDELPSLVALPGLVERLVELASFRQYREFFSEGAKFCDAPDSDARELPGMVSKAVERIQSSLPATMTCPTIGDVISRLGEKPIPGVETGIAFFDESNRHGGAARAQPTYIGAETGVGKTVLGVQIARHVASRGGNVLFATFELPQDAITRRMLCQQSGHWSKYDADMCNEGHLYAQAIEEQKFWDVTYYDPAEHAPGSNTVESFCEYAERTNEKYPWDLIVVDYAQIMRSRQRFNNDLQRHEHVAEELRMMVKRTKCAMIVLAQAIRDQNDRGRLRLRNAREFENGANAILLLDRQKTKEDDEVTWLYTEKNRDGRRVKKKVFLHTPFGLFRTVGEPIPDNVYRGGE